MKALVLSGGGSKGAYVGGMLQYMKQEMGKDYNLYYGSSTGTLLQMLSSIDDFNSLKEGYTTMDINKMYDISPFKKKKKGQDVNQASINFFSVLRMLIFRRQPTFGDNRKFKKVIKKFFPYEKYIEAYDRGVDLTVVVTNMSKVRSEYYNMKSLGRDKKSYEDFIEWTWTSTCAVPFTSITRKIVGSNGNIIRNGKDKDVYADYYADGGFMEHMPISKAILDGATYIDAITTSTEDYSSDKEPEFCNNPLKLLSRMFDITLRESMERDIQNAKKLAKDKDVVLNLYYMPRNLTDNSMYFDKEVMTNWWNEGYEYAKENHNSKKKMCKTIKMRAKK